MFENEFNEKYNKPAIWSPKSIFWISVFFSFIAGGIMYIINYKRLGYTHKVKTQTFYIVLAIIGIIVASTFIEMNLISWGINLVIANFYKDDQKELFENHIKLGGKKASVRIPLIVYILCTGVYWGLIYWADILENEDLGFTPPTSSYIYENHPELYKAIIKNENFKGEFTVDYVQRPKDSYANHIHAEGLINGKELRVVSSYENVYEYIPYKEVYINGQILMRKEGKDKPWISNQLSEDNRDKLYEYNSFKGYRIISLNKLIRASKEDISKLEKVKIPKTGEIKRDLTMYEITFRENETFTFANPINDRVNYLENGDNTEFDLTLLINSQDEIVWEYGGFLNNIGYENCEIDYDHIGEDISIERPEIK
ncbi:hypothetical protein [Anaeromicrobium sediminis]|uniref:Uncharacterized protein n=1 Tax=Anaeromicrobium sediminis TaxID=1478221 RepID=A0A267MGX7_9FIRM|nr:hypothetical protein [Anaeromicrobium sediminis]PAB58717.1 hypothetical protein CCE28_13685 [Anaeromicrobium sediminis]